MKTMMMILLFALAFQAEAASLRCVGVDDSSLLVTVEKEKARPIDPNRPIQIKPGRARHYVVRVFSNGILQKEERASMEIGIASNFYNSDTLHLNDGLFGESGMIFDREAGSGFRVHCDAAID